MQAIHRDLLVLLCRATCVVGFLLGFRLRTIIPIPCCTREFPDNSARFVGFVCPFLYDSIFEIHSFVKVQQKILLSMSSFSRDQDGAMDSIWMQKASSQRQKRVVPGTSL